MSDDRFDKGWETVNRINAEGAQRQWDSLSAISPDFARWIVESAYCDVLGRPQLALRDREIATLAALATLGNAPGQLKAHVEGALNVGLALLRAGCVVDAFRSAQLRRGPAYCRHDLALCRGKQSGGPSSATRPVHLTAPALRPAG